MMQYKGIKGQWSFFFFKDTWKRPQISMFNSNSVHRESLLLLLYWSTPAQGKGGGLCPRCSDDSLRSYLPCLWPSSLGWTCHHLTSIRFWTQTRKWADKLKDRWKTWACCDSWDDVCLNPPSWPTRWTGLPGSSSSLPSSLKSVRQSLQDGVWCEHHVHKNLPFEL